MKTGGESVVHRRDKGVAKEAKEVKVVAGFAGVGCVDVDGQLFSFVFVKIKKFVTYM